MKWLAMVLLLAGAGCKISPLVYQCSSDLQCSGSGGRCVDGACAFPSTSCPTGLAFDPSATSGRGGQCVMSDQLNDADMAMDSSNDDLGGVVDMAGPSPDLWMPPCVWTATNNLPENSRRIWALDASHLAAAGTNFLVSNTSGLGWTAIQLRDMASTVMTPRALFATGTTFWAIGNGMNVWSIDSSTNTVTLDYHPATTNSNDISGIWGASASDLWTIGDGAVPIHRVGTTWTLASMSAAMGNDMFSMHGSSATNVWAAGDSYVTHWDGSNWTPQMLNVGGSAINSIWTRDSMNVYIVNGGGNYYATHDGGANWGGGPTGLTTGLAIYGFPGHLYIAGNGNKVAHSIDDGAHWTLEDVGFPASTAQIDHVSGRSAHEVYVVAGTWWSICK